MSKIILLGYMGSGKSTIAKLLAEKINIPFKDLDEIIEIEENLSIKNIFEQKGELYFRKIEHAALKKLTASAESFVLSLGGGTPCYSHNHRLIEGKGIVSIYLKASVEELYQRLSNEKDTRPLIAFLNNAERKEFIAKHVFERSFFYNKATNTVVVDHKNATQVVTEIENLLV